MAEWGKGDPRWIVEERPDGRRVGQGTSSMPAAQSISRSSDQSEQLALEGEERHAVVERQAPRSSRRCASRQ